MDEELFADDETTLLVDVTVATPVETLGAVVGVEVPVVAVAAAVVEASFRL